MLMIDGLKSLCGHRRLRPGAARTALHNALSALDVEQGTGQTVLSEKELLLDVSAWVVEAAGELHKAGRHVEALALEGIEARLLAALVGASTEERCNGAAHDDQVLEA
jgi:hypothetical protein